MGGDPGTGGAGGGEAPRDRTDEQNSGAGGAKHDAENPDEKRKRAEGGTPGKEGGASADAKKGEEIILHSDAARLAVREQISIKEKGRKLFDEKTDWAKTTQKPSRTDIGLIKIAVSAMFLDEETKTILQKIGFDVDPNKTILQETLETVGRKAAPEIGLEAGRVYAKETLLKALEALGTIGKDYKFDTKKLFEEFGKFLQKPNQSSSPLINKQGVLDREVLESFLTVKNPKKIVSLFSDSLKLDAKIAASLGTPAAPHAPVAPATAPPAVLAAPPVAPPPAALQASVTPAAPAAAPTSPPIDAPKEPPKAPEAPASNPPAASEAGSKKQPTPDAPPSGSEGSPAVDKPGTAAQTPEEKSAATAEIHGKNILAALAKRDFGTAIHELLELVSIRMAGFLGGFSLAGMGFAAKGVEWIQNRLPDGLLKNHGLSNMQMSSLQKWQPPATPPMIKQLAALATQLSFQKVPKNIINDLFTEQNQAAVTKLLDKKIKLQDNPLWATILDAENTAKVAKKTDTKVTDIILAIEKDMDAGSDGEPAPASAAAPNTPATPEKNPSQPPPAAPPLRQA